MVVNVREMGPQFFFGKSRLVKYCNLARFMYFCYILENWGGIIERTNAFFYKELGYVTLCIIKVEFARFVRFAEM